MKVQTSIFIKANRPNSVKIWVGAILFSNKHKNLKNCKLATLKLKTPANNANQKLENPLYEKPKRVAEWYAELAEVSKKPGVF